MITFYQKTAGRFLPLCILGSFLALATVTFGQSAGPCDANPFCSDSAYNFANATSGVAVTGPNGPNYGCLYNQPGPAWYFMQIGTAGTMQLSLSQQTYGGTPIDVDFAMWGPFTSLSAGCAAIMSNNIPPLQCSYSAAPNETLGLGLTGGTGTGQSTPPAAQVGEVYIVLITNYASSYMGAGSAGTISFAQTGGTGSADCGIVCGLTASNSGSVCLGYASTLMASTTDTVNTFTYHWSGPNGFTAIGQSVTVTPTQLGANTYTVTAVSQDDDTCIASTDVFVNGYPDVTLTDTTDKLLCNISGTWLSLANPDTTASYQWYRNDTAISGATDSAVNADQSGTYKVVAVSDSGCTAVSVSVDIIKSSVHADFEFTADFGCTGDTVTFVNLSDPGDYWWNFGDSTTTTDSSMQLTHVYQQHAAYMVQLVVQNPMGCLDTAIHFVDVSHPLEAMFTQSADSICQTDGTPVQFTDESIGAVENWQWDFGDGGTATIQNPSHTYTLAGTHQIRLIIGDSIPCYDTAYRSIYVDSLPFLTMTGDKDFLCTGDKVRFNIDYLQPAQSIHWDFGDGTVWEDQSGAVAAGHSYEEPGTYYISVDIAYPVCAATHAYDSIIVNSYPYVDLGPDSVLCLDGNALTLWNHAENTIAITRLQWNTGDTTQQLVVRHPGTYTLTAYAGDCATTESVTVDKDCYTDIPNAFTPDGDGANDYFYPRQLLTSGVRAFSMTIYNRWGEKIFETTSVNGRGWDGKFNGEEQPVGVYIYQIQVVYKNGKMENYDGNVTLIR